jgi:phosphoribosylanthranilate isomerase
VTQLRPERGRVGLLDFEGARGDKRHPMSVLVKICGIDSLAAADAALSAGADFAGLVFYKKSPRNLDLEQAAALASRMRGRTKLVALFADAGDSEIEGAVRAARPDFLQLHGGETPQRAGAIRARFGLPVIKALPVAEPDDLANVNAYTDAVDMFLFDAKAPQGAATPGGLGAAFDWQLLRGRSFARSWLLAGGLNAGNVARAIRVSGAPGIDVSSGVESAPGVKDAGMIHEFIAAARRAAFSEAGA